MAYQFRYTQKKSPPARSMTGVPPIQTLSGQARSRLTLAGLLPRRGRLLSPANPKVGLGFSAAQRDGVLRETGHSPSYPRPGSSRRPAQAAVTRNSDGYFSLGNRQTNPAQLFCPLGVCHAGPWFRSSRPRTYTPARCACCWAGSLSGCTSCRGRPGGAPWSGRRGSRSSRA